MEQLKKKILEEIQDFFENKESDLSEFVKDNLFEDLKLAMDLESLSDNISTILNENTYTFESSAYGDDFCHTCQKPFCDFVSKSGERIQADDILKKDFKFIRVM